jgi:Zn ribbon nucleic-acid-binding protein
MFTMCSTCFHSRQSPICAPIRGSWKWSDNFESGSEYVNATDCCPNLGSHDKNALWSNDLHKFRMCVECRFKTLCRSFDHNAFLSWDPKFGQQSVAFTYSFPDSKLSLHFRLPLMGAQIGLCLLCLCLWHFLHCLNHGGASLAVMFRNTHSIMDDIRTLISAKLFGVALPMIFWTLQYDDKYLTILTICSLFYFDICYYLHCS